MPAHQIQDQNHRSKNPALLPNMLWASMVLIAAWFFHLPNEWEGFLRDPLLNLPTTLFFALLGAFASNLTDHVLCQSMPRMFCRRRNLAVPLIAATISVLLPFHPATGLLFGCLLLAGRALTTLAAMNAAERCQLLGSVDGIRGIFFISGMAALIYQVSWQRKLIGLLGADGQSVTVIVAVFLAGLGCGALLGEKLAQRISGRQGVMLFCAIEAAIGLFGVFSMSWLEWIGSLVGASIDPLVVVSAAAAALATPTILMGMTLPLLVETLKEKVPTVHENVGHLYALNALGSASAAILAATTVFPFVGLTGSTWVAALLNGVTAILVYLASQGWQQSPARNNTLVSEATGGRLTWPLAAAFALLTGLVSIGQEILLLRMMSWTSAARPWVFGLGVGAYLLGMGFGSQRAARINKDRIMTDLGKMWLATALAVFIIPALAAFVSGLSFNASGLPLLVIGLVILGFFGGSSLPLIAGSTQADHQGRMHFGAIYAANIVGAVLGSGLTGYILLDRLPTAQCLALSALASLLLGLAFTAYAGKTALRLNVMLPAAALLLALPFTERIYDRWMEKMFDGSAADAPFIQSVETRAGIVAVKLDPPSDMIIGGGAYDGRFNIDPKLDSNAIHRVYMAMALYPEPRRVLEIGLSSGSWAKAILSFPSVTELSNVEINPGYERIIAATPLVADILTDPRMHRIYTDGRKWLRAHDTKWDAIIINNSFNWREGATLLHSVEFMALAKSRLVPGGVLFLNTTGASDIAATALTTFPAVFQISTGIVAVNGPATDFSSATLAQRLQLSTEFSRHYPTLDAAQAWVNHHLPKRLAHRNYRNCKVLTDDAMILEWGKSHCQPIQ